jgi:hypothetical protein
MRKAWLLAALAAPLCGSAQAQMPPLTTWVWQLSGGSVRQTYAAKVYDIDMEDTSSGVIGQLKSQGHTVICYFSAGTWEDWRSDASAFPASVRGKAVSGWAGESWLDTRSQVVRDLMAKRMDMAKAKGCNGLEPDNVDGYSNNPGFPPRHDVTSLDLHRGRVVAASGHDVVWSAGSTDSRILCTASALQRRRSGLSARFDRCWRSCAIRGDRAARRLWERLHGGGVHTRLLCDQHCLCSAAPGSYQQGSRSGARRHLITRPAQVAASLKGQGCSTLSSWAG